MLLLHQHSGDPVRREIFFIVTFKSQVLCKVQTGKGDNLLQLLLLIHVELLELFFQNLL